MSRAWADGARQKRGKGERMACGVLRKGPSMGMILCMEGAPCLGGVFFSVQMGRKDGSKMNKMFVWVGKKARKCSAWKTFPFDPPKGFTSPRFLHYEGM